MSNLMPGATSSVDTARLDTHPDVELKTYSGCCSSSEYYVLNQSFAIVRHADRLDHTEHWQSYSERQAYPNDTPLTTQGFTHARQVGDILAKSVVPWKLIVASPYFRCAQTASCIAEKLQVPVHFDLDLGEVFDDVSMSGECKGRAQHRSPDVLEKCLIGDFPDVEYIRDEAGKYKVEGQLQRFPENFDGARMRYCYKVQKLVQQAAIELSSIVIVTHGDAVASVVGLLKEHWIIKHIPYTAYAIGARQVKVKKAKDKEMLPEEPVYTHPEQWNLTLDPGVIHLDCKRADYAKAHKIHEQEMVEMEKKHDTIKTTYELTPHQHHHIGEALDHLEVSKKDKKHLLAKAGKSTFASDNRIGCHPQHDEKHALQKTNSTNNADGKVASSEGSK